MTSTSPTSTERLTAEVRAGRSVRLAVVGDSIAMGYFGGHGYYGLVDGRAGSWPTRLAETLQRRGLDTTTESWFGGGNADGLGGDGAGSGPGGALCVEDYDPRLAIGAGWARRREPTLGGHLYESEASTQSTSFRPATPTDRCEIFFATTPTSGGFDVLIDDAMVDQVPVGASDGFNSVVATADAVGDHVYAVRPRTTGSVALAGMAAWATDRPALQILNMGWASAWTRGYSDRSRPWSPLNALTSVAADHVLIALGVNDWMSAVYVPDITSGPEETEANLQIMVDALLPLGGVSLMVPFPSRADAPMPDAATQGRYMDAVRWVADRNALPLIDLPGHYGDWASANRDGWIDDPVHPNRRAHFDIGDRVADALFR